MSAYNRWLDNKKTYCLITGASRGLGKTLALRFAERLSSDSVLVLIATDLSKLQQCKTEINHLAPKIKVDVHQLDLSKPNADVFQRIISDSFTNTKSQAGDFEQAIIIHNAATTGEMKYAVDASNPEEWASYLQLNVTSPICLNSVFFKIFDVNTAHKLLINITSIAAMCPLETAAFYNTGKAAREIFFHTLALENPEITVLSYSPGFLQTDMGEYVKNNISHPTAQQRFKEACAKGMHLTCDQTTSKLFEILAKGDFKSGQRIDYHDRH
ncbi:hypothetical protein CHUAL_013453 [Chamberlinius hualienensis]